VNAALIKLKTENEAFRSDNYNWDVGGLGKRLIIQHPTMDVVIIANFEVNPINIVPGFTQTGTWYDYFGGFPIDVNDLNNPFLLEPGEYRVYTTVELETPDISVGIEEVDFGSGQLLSTYPNPFIDFTQVSYRLDRPQQVQIRVMDMQGKIVDVLYDGRQYSGNHMVQWDGNDRHGAACGNGIYLIQLITDGGAVTTKVVLQK
jgi:hypothetical protein